MREYTQPRIGFCLLAGALAGFVNGFFGAGGGMVLVPLLIWLCRLEDKAAFSSAIAVILPLCIVSIVIYALHDSLPVSDALPYLIGGAAGGVLAGLLFRKMPARALHLILGGVTLRGYPADRMLTLLAAAAAGACLRRFIGLRHRRRKPADGLDDRCPVHGAASGAGCESAVFSSLCGLRADLSYQK